MDLNAQLKTLRREFAENADSRIVDAFSSADAELRTSSVLDGCIKAGDPMPDFSLSDANGDLVSLPRLLSRGPVAISFYRGDWCDFCALELIALAEIYHEILELGASLVAISPQPPQERVRPEFGELPFPMLWDDKAKLARRCGITYSIPVAMRPIYASGGFQPYGLGEAGWSLPIPATYILDRTGIIVLSWLNTNYTCRVEPRDVVTMLSHLHQQSKRELSGPQ
ncbi:peroxiredoxin-like family protein [Cupriavidus necator]|uniref:peroxiredoxin-like family protein n=1 Tax=Cupriavidus necator TaxID=106590 RepID=UPI00068B3930|nr:peroxiredoxin-like family protein [Cupriavidus necator]